MSAAEHPDRLDLDVIAKAHRDARRGGSWYRQSNEEYAAIVAAGAAQLRAENEAMQRRLKTIESYFIGGWPDDDDLVMVWKLADGRHTGRSPASDEEVNDG